MCARTRSDDYTWRNRVTWRARADVWVHAGDFDSTWTGRPRPLRAAKAQALRWSEQRDTVWLEAVTDGDGVVLTVWLVAEREPLPARYALAARGWAS